MPNVEQKIDRLTEIVERIADDVGTLKSDVGELKSDVKSLTGQVDHLAITMLEHQAGIDDLRQRMGRAEETQERGLAHVDKFLVILNRHETELAASIGRHDRLEERVGRIERMR